MSALDSGAAAEPSGAALPGQDEEIANLRAEIDRLKSEQAELQEQLAVKAPARPRARLHSVATAAMTGLCCLLIFLSAITVWIHQTVISTSGFVNTVGPIVDDPVVTGAASVQLTNQIFSAIPVEKELAQVLPPRGKFLAGPLTSGAHSFVEGQIANVLRSSKFRTVWYTVLRATHSEVIAALRGQSKVLTVSNGAVLLNTLPLVDAAMIQIQSTASGLLGRNITLPKITSVELPEQARAALSKALGINLPSNFGQIELAKASSLDVARNSVQLLDLLFWLLPLVTALTIVVTLWTSNNRRHTALLILIGTALVLILEDRAVEFIQGRIIASLASSNFAAGGDVVRQFLSGLISATWWLVAFALVGVALLLITGSYPWAENLRGRIAHVSKNATQAVAGRARVQPTLSWVVAHYRVLQIGGAVVGGILLLVVPGWWLFVIAALLVGYEVALWRITVIRGGAPPPLAPVGRSSDESLSKPAASAP